MIRFTNSQPLLLDHDGYGQLLEAAERRSNFPTMHDFEFSLRDCFEMGFHLDMASSEHGALASFPYWDFAERQIPQMGPWDLVGSHEEPFNDCDQCWQLLIWRSGPHVNVMQGDSLCCVQFPTYFRVAADRWTSEWEKLRRRIR